MQSSTSHRHLLLALALTLAACGAQDDSLAIEGEGLDPEEHRWLSPKAQGKADDAYQQLGAMKALPARCTTTTATITPYFSPDDPTVSIELHWIQKIVDARKADPNQYAEGQNPYTIRFAVYNLTHPVIIQRLIEAERDHGVDVQVLIEGDQLEKSYNDTAKRFSEGGLEVVMNHNALTPTTRLTADLIGIKKAGLMHLKTRLYEAPGVEAVITGSMNPNRSSGGNEENIQLIQNDPQLIARYRHGYEAVLADKPFDNTWDPNAGANVLFSPHTSGVDPAGKILQWLSEEQEQILLMVFTLRDIRSPQFAKSLVEVIRERAQAGVPVYIITDRKQADGVDIYGNRTWSFDDWTEDKLRQAGAHVYEAVNDGSAYFGFVNPYVAMHHKTAILGRTNIRLITDATNWTKAALGGTQKNKQTGQYEFIKAKNVETTLFIDTAKLPGNSIGQRYLAQWMLVLERYAQQSVDRDGELPASAVLADLTSRPGWPTQQVGFELKASTYWGQRVHVTGDQPALHSWLQKGAGLALDPANYPTWGGGDVALPLGQRFAWKGVKRFWGAVGWERGDNRPGHAIPAVCSALADSTVHTGVYR